MAPRSPKTPLQQLEILLRGRKENLSIPELLEVLKGEGEAVTLDTLNEWSATHSDRISRALEAEAESYIIRLSSPYSGLIDATARLVVRVESLVGMLEETVIVANDLMRTKIKKHRK